MKYIIIGNSAAGLAAAKEIRCNDKTGNITIIGKEKFPAYGRPMISYYLKGKIELDKLPIHNEDYYKDNNIDIIYDEAVKIDKDNKQVKLISNKTMLYDKLIIATGSVPFVPPVKNLDKQSNVYTFLDIENAKALKNVVNNNSKVVILGGGLIALKAAEGLRGITPTISVVELADRILPTILDNNSAKVVQSHIEEQGIKFYLSNTISEVIGRESVDKVILKSGDELDCDVLIVAVGVRPDTAIAKDAGVEVARGIVVDNHMRTNIADIYAAGDVTEVIDVLDNKSKIIALWPNAVIGGRIAGANASGKERVNDGCFPYNAIDFFGLRMITGGIINPDDSYAVKVIEDNNGHSSFIIKDDKLYGYILLGNVQRAGIFTDIIRNGYSLSECNDILSSRNFLSYCKSLRDTKYRGNKL